MAKLYFKYGAMGSSKSAQALIAQFNYEELGMSVWLIKPSVDDRDGASIVQSRIGLKREAEVITSLVVEGRRAADVAKEKGFDVSHVYRIQRKALQKLRSWFQQEGVTNRS